MESAVYADSGISPHLRRELGNTGINVSPLGFGASPLGNEFGTIDVSMILQTLFSYHSPQFSSNFQAFKFPTGKRGYPCRTRGY